LFISTSLVRYTHPFSPDPQDLSGLFAEQYRQRASVEPPRELRRHPDPIRYTLVAAFCWLRSQEITDNLVELLIQIV
jgi:hypothetical protein